jgi:hypothetical protein
MKELRFRSGIPAWVLIGLSGGFPRVSAQQSVKYVPEDHRPPLFLRETWRDPGIQETPVRQEHMTG